MSEHQSMRSSSASNIPDHTNNPLSLWTLFIKNGIDFLPEEEKLDVQALAKEYDNLIQESVKCNHDFKGYRNSAPFSPKLAEWMYSNWMPDRGDVLVAAYPKTGNYSLFIFNNGSCSRMLMAHLK